MRYSRFKHLTLVMIILLVSACGETPVPEDKSPLLVSTFTLNQPISQQIREFNGQVVAAELTPLSFRINGEIESINIKPGQMVKQGDLMARLDDRKQRQALSEAESQFELAQKQFLRAEGLVSQKLVTESNFEEFEAALKLATINLKSIRAQLSYCELRAPFTGMIAEVKNEAFETIKAGEPVVQFYRNDLVYVRLQLPDNLLAQANPNERRRDYQPKARFADSDQVYLMSYLEHTLEPSPHSQAFEFWLHMPQPEKRILPGSSVTVTVDMKAAGLIGKQGVLLPVTALEAGSNDGEFYVWKIIDGKARRDAITVIQVRTDGVLVSQGIEQGDQIITSRLSQLREGDAVQDKIQGSDAS